MKRWTEFSSEVSFLCSTLIATRWLIEVFAMMALR